MIHLDFHKDLPKIRAAFDAGELQMQSADRRFPTVCSYENCCAVGVCLTPEQRTQLDNSPDDTGVSFQILAGRVSVPAGQKEDWEWLQKRHDAGDVKVFGRFLDNLESRYARQATD